MGKYYAKEDTKQVGIWIRVSTEDIDTGDTAKKRVKTETIEPGDDNGSEKQSTMAERLEHHEKRARYYAESREWEVVEVYRLEATSGKSVIGLPETNRMLADIKSGRITGLIFSKLARLARNTKELLEFADIFRDHSADLISLGESIDTSTPAGRLFYTIVAAMAQWEREEISARVAASVPVRAQLGKPIGGQAPFGYQWKDRKLVPDPKEAPIRKLLFELFAEHKRFKTVARLLNQSGYRTRSGAKFSDTTIERLLTDPIAKGLRRANYTKSLGNKKHWELKPESEWVFSEVEAIVSDDLWERCNGIIADRSNGTGKKPARKAVQLFAGLAHCHCGGKMYVPSNSPKYICYQCRNKIPVEDLETVFHEQLRGFFFSPDELSAYLSEADRFINDKEELLDGLERERGKLQTEMDKLFELYMAGEIPKEGFGKRYQPLETRLKQIDDQIPQLQGEVDFLKIQHLSSDEIIREARDFYTRWPELDQTEKRQVIETITEKIIISSDEVVIDLCYLPSSAELMASWQRNNRGSSPRPA